MPLLEALLEMQPALPGFTTMAVSGHGERFEGTRVQEQVRGRIDRCMTWLVLPQEDVERVLDQLRRLHAATRTSSGGWNRSTRWGGWHEIRHPARE